MNITNDKVTDYITSFYQPLNDTLAGLRNQSEADRIPLILKETEMLFRTVLRMMPIRRILEIGTAYGYSSVFFATLLPNAVVTTVESDDMNYQIAMDNIEELNLTDRIQIMHGDGEQAMKALADEKENNETFLPFDLIFIDAAKSHYRDFFDQAERICSENGLIICDNILMRAFIVDESLDKRRRHRTSVKRMQEFLEYIYSRNDLDASLISCGDGLLIIRKKEENEKY